MPSTQRLESGGKPVALGDIADYIGAKLPKKDRSILISSLATLKNADAASLCYCQSSKLRDVLTTTDAAAVIVPLNLAESCPTIALVVDRPRLSWAFLSSYFFPRPSGVVAGISEHAVLAESATIGSGVNIEAQCSVADGAVIGDNVSLAAGVRIGAGVVIGAGCHIGSNVVIYGQTSIGKECIIHAGVVVGGDGFGFEPDAQGHWHKISQLAGVEIGNRVEIGANTTVDCGSLTATRIADGVKIDSQVQIGHGVSIGEDCVISAGTGIAGSTIIGAGCLIGGMVGIVDNIRIAERTMVAGGASVLSSVDTPGQVLTGTIPAKPGKYWSKWIAGINRSHNIKRKIGKSL